tara:strand:- start:448 stop:756 length:309 start_codon:yes stop_codon:yes gene_type:complete
MKRFIFIFIFILLPSKVFADYILEPANCTLKKQINCGAYLYNNKNGTTYFCTLEECKEIMGALEEVVVEETQGSKGSKKSKIPKFKKKEKKKSKIPKFKKSE